MGYSLQPRVSGLERSVLPVKVFRAADWGVMRILVTPPA